MDEVSSEYGIVVDTFIKGLKCGVILGISDCVCWYVDIGISAEVDIYYVIKNLVHE